jgi:hypothetical protein
MIKKKAKRAEKKQWLMTVNGVLLGLERVAIVSLIVVIIGELVR